MAPHTPALGRAPAEPGRASTSHAAMTAGAHHFDAPLGAAERRKTLAAMIVSIGGGTLAGVFGMAQTGNIGWLFLSLPFTIVLFVMAQFAPRGYRIAPEGLRIERKFCDRVIPWRDVRGIDAEPRQLRGISVTASRGIFGWFGWFWSVRFGLYQLFVTDQRRILWLHTERGLVGVSPDRPEEFAARVREKTAG